MVDHWDGWTADPMVAPLAAEMVVLTVLLLADCWVDSMAAMWVGMMAAWTAVVMVDM